jgi:predicted Ser/Thr protein kinase
MNEPEANQMEKRCPQCGASLPAGALEGLCPACLLKQGASETGTQPESAPFQPPTAEEVAKLFPQLEVLGFIGKGGMGAVYKARQPALDRLVALKILPPQVASSPGFAERFNREARALAKLNHPNIVAVHEFGQVNGLAFIIMEFVDGLNLRQLERSGKLSPREALQIVPQICEALQFAHDEGIVHRDIKPENILVDKKGRIKIADFGIAKIVGREADAGLTETRGVIGTPQYMAPEQVEKPQEVDHRADIFSLGVVFYEMLTGELPLGKFAPPSSRMRGVGVDVRLDEVVLRALEKEPERRYQHASQVKTAVETISSSSPPADPEALAREILTRDYDLDIRSCLRRGWALVKSDFWPIVGITALAVLLLQAAYSTAVGLVVGGPLMGGLALYYLKRIRGEPAVLDTIFSGFRVAFLPLLLAGLVTFLLKLVGFLCFILPGIYLAVIWIFTMPLVIDKRLDFWQAMELSRKVVTKHWWKFLGFWLLLALMNVVGVIPCGIGLFITAPITAAALMYAYEDILGVAGRATTQPAAVGPSGTEVLPGNAGRVHASGGVGRSVALVASALALLLLVIMVTSLFHTRRGRERRAWQEADEAARVLSFAQEAEAAAPFAFGPVFERVLTIGTNSDFLDFDTGKVLHHPADAYLDPADAAQSELTTWARENGSDIGFVTNRSTGAVELMGFGIGIFSFGKELVPDDERPANGALSAVTNIWNDLQAEQLLEYHASLMDKPRTAWFPSNALNYPTIFETREGAFGLLQAIIDSDNPPGLKIRYKLANQSPGSSAAGSGDTRKRLRATLAERLEAATAMSGTSEKDASLAAVAKDAAIAGETELVKQALRRIGSTEIRDESAYATAVALAKRGLRKPAIDIAKTIASNETRDRALAELAK